MKFSSPHSSRVHVAVGVILNTKNQVLISKRHDHLHQGGLWEFPGGKVEKEESVETALQRELLEELNIKPIELRPLISVPHDYNDKQVYLDVYKVTAFTGIPVSSDQQELQWVDIADLYNYIFPAANAAIVSALMLPDNCVITGAIESVESCKLKVQVAVARSIGLIQLRQKEMPDVDYLALSNELLDITQSSKTRIILNSSLELFMQTNADGLHFTGQRLRDCKQRPIAADKLFSVSTHTLEELEHAVNIGADFAMLSPVLPTQSHPGKPALGWETFNDIVRQISIPVYALGGMKPEYIKQAWNHGGQGIAAISALWNEL